MRNKLLILLFTTCVMGSGCVETPSLSLSPSTPGGNHDRIDQFIRNGWDFKLGHTREKVIQNLGTPGNITVTTMGPPVAPNPRSPENMPPDELIELNYDGLHIGIYRAVHENEELLQHVSITDGKYKVKSGLGIGATKNAVRAGLGKPSKIDDDADVYVTQHGANSYVQFFYENDIVSRVDWWYFFD